MRSRDLRRSITTLAILCASLAALFAAAQPSHAATGVGWFTYRHSDCKEISDPLNVLWQGPLASLLKVKQLVFFYAQWQTTTPFAGRTQYARAQSTCHKNDAQYAKNFTRKYHVRLFAGKNIPDDQGGNFVAGDAHFEIKDSDCQHLASLIVDDNVPARVNGRSGFDEGAYRMYLAMKKAGVYATVKKYTGTHRTFLQCNNNRTVYWSGTRYVFSPGYVGNG